MASKIKYKKIINQSIKYLLVTFFAMLFIFPFLFMLSTSLKGTEEIFAKHFTLIPKKIDLKNYQEAFHTIPYLKYTLNTLFITVLNICGQLLVSPMVAYSLAKIKWFGRKIIFTLVLATMLLPYQVTMIPIYMIWQRLGLVGSYVPLIAPAFFGYPFYIIILRQFFMTIPDSLMESARIDGASELKIYWRIILPICKPALSAVAIFTFLFTWSDFLRPLLYLTSQERYTLSLGLQQFLSEHTVAWGQLTAAAAMFTIPIVIMFFFFQRYFIEGIVTTGLKG